MSDVVIWHNPRCSKSRETLALLEARGITPVVRRYLDDAPDLDELRAAQAALGLPAIAMMRVKEKLFSELGLSTDTPEDRLLDAMAAHPRLIERPVVLAKGKARIGRPPEAVTEIL